MRIAITTIVLALSACSDPSLQIHFEVPSAYQETVVAVSLQIIVPPAAQPFGCEQLAFQEITDETVRLSVVQSVVAQDDHGLGLSGIPRKDTKLLYLRGLDKEDLAVVAGCVEVGVIDDAMTVVVQGEPTTLVGFDNTDPGKVLPEIVRVDVTDTTGTRLSNTEVRWTVLGPKGEPSQGTTLTDNDGTAMAAPVMPTLAGPVTMEIRARWTRLTPPSLNGFQSPEPVATMALPFEAKREVATDAVYRVGRIGPNGEIGVVALSVGEDAQTQRRVLVAYFDLATKQFVTATSALIPNAIALGMVSRAGRDHVFTITTDAWIEIAPNGTLATFPSPRPGRAAKKIVPVSCNPTGDIDRVLIQFDNSSYLTVTSDREQVNSAFDNEGIVWQLQTGGCVSDINGDEFPVVVYARPFSTDNAILELISEMDIPRRGDVNTLRIGMGFAPALGTDPAYLLGAQFSIDGSSLARYQLSEGGGETANMLLATEDQTTTPARASAGGDVDGDGISDVIGVLAFGENQAGEPQYRVFVSLGATHKGERLVGLSDVAVALRPHLWLADFDADGFDDMLIGTPNGFVVLRMGIVN